jgi:hypothetical protein
MECLSCQNGLELAVMCQVPRRCWVVGRLGSGLSWEAVPRTGRRALNGGAIVWYWGLGWLEVLKWVFGVRDGDVETRREEMSINRVKSLM